MGADTDTRTERERIEVAARRLEPEATGVALIERVRGGEWVGHCHRRGCVWDRKDAEAEAHALARVGYRARIVPLLRGTPVEIEGGSE